MQMQSFRHRILFFRNSTLLDRAAASTRILQIGLKLLKYFYYSSFVLF